MIGLLALAGERAARGALASSSPVESQTSAAMASAARTWLASLGPDLAKKATFPFDGAERYNWNFLPGEYPGVMLAQMSPAQRSAAHELLRSALSSQGYLKTTSIFALENVLREISEKAGRPAPHRDPLLYSFAVFGEPDMNKPWGWRMQGHHVSLQFTSVDGDVVCHTPMFYGAHPATVPEGPFAGLRVLGFEEDLGRALVKSLSDVQRKQATLEGKIPDDIVLGPGRAAGELKHPAGLRAAEMTTAQKTLLISLVDQYITNLRPDLAGAERARILEWRVDDITFAWAGGLEPGMPHYYRLHSPLFIVEYDNTQDGANHPHTVWRDPARDFGGDPLAEHLKKDHGAGKK